MTKEEQRGVMFKGEPCPWHPKLGGKRYASDWSCPSCVHYGPRGAQWTRRRAMMKAARVPLSPEEQKRIKDLYAEARRLDWEVHHIKPLAAGGKHHPDNLQVIPARLNRAIGAQDIDPLTFMLG